MRFKNRTIEIYILALLVLTEAFGALYGGYSMIIDPTGEKLKFPAGMLDNTIFPDYLIPGIILFTLLGILPLFLAYSLLFKPDWHIFNFLNIYAGYHWAWTYTLYMSILLVLWINIQMILINIGSVIQGVTGLLGSFILILTLMPRVKRQYRVQIHRKKV